MESGDFHFEMDTNLPKLIGTQKQINWAAKIRKKYLEKYYCIINNPDYPVLKKEWAQIIYELSIHHTSAAWWIESGDFL